MQDLNYQIYIYRLGGSQPLTRFVLFLIQMRQYLFNKKVCFKIIDQVQNFKGREENWVL
jgi:hypothetical protein